MARQAGQLILKGKIGNLIYYSYRGKPVVRMDSSKPAEWYKTAPSFERSMENCDEFGWARTTAAVIKHSMNPLLPKVKEGPMNNRLAKTVHQLLREDTVSERGDRVLTAENFTQMKGFEYNKDAILKNLIHFKHETTIDAEKGIVSVFVKPDVIKNCVTAPSGATHFKLMAGVASIDLENMKSESTYKETKAWEIDSEETMGFLLELNLPSTKGSLMVVLGVQFADDTNGLLDWKGYVKKNGMKMVEIV
jgi:hypothetical protein